MRLPLKPSRQHVFDKLMCQSLANTCEVCLFVCFAPPPFSNTLLFLKRRTLTSADSLCFLVVIHTAVAASATTTMRRIAVVVVCAAFVSCVRGSAAAAAYSPVQAPDISGYLYTPQFLCENNCVCDRYTARQRADNATFVTLTPQYSSLCQCPGQPFYMVIPETLPTAKTAVPCGFNPQFNSFCKCSVFPVRRWPYMGVNIYCDDGGGA